VKRVLVLVALLAGVCALAPETAAALTRKQANAVAMRVLHPQAGKKAVILFGLPAALRKGARVVPADPTKKRLHPTKLRGAAWLFWLDQVPYAKFSHPSRYLLVDDRSGRVVLNAATGWYPTVNTKLPAFLATRTSYAAQRYRVFARLPKRKVAFRDPTPSFLRADPFVAQATLPPHALDGECVLIISDYTDDPRLLNDQIAVSDWSQGMKIPTYFGTGSGAVTTLPGKEQSAMEGKDLDPIVTDLIQKKKCKDIVLYMSGHGIPEQAGEAGVMTSNKVIENEDGTKEAATKVSPLDILLMLPQHLQTGFKVKVDSCFSGRFRDTLFERDENGKLVPHYPNLLILETSSSAKKESSFANDYVDGNDNPNHVSEFTNQNLTGLKEFFSSQKEIDAAAAAGGSLVAHALDRAFDLGEDANNAVDQFGHPILPDKTTNLGPPAPLPTPIKAVFDSDKFTTTYTEDATAPPGQTLKYAWSLKFDADTKCITGFKPSSPTPNQATWYHADTSIGGPCGHLSTQLGTRGHKGTVTVVVSDDNWTCTLTYAGTEGDGGQKTGVGDPLVPCQRK
jgi:hypothetical protein